MAGGLRIVLIIVVLLPLFAMVGMPDRVPPWLNGYAGGVPVVIWLTMAGFAILTAASWLPLGRDGNEGSGR